MAVIVVVRSESDSKIKGSNLATPTEEQNESRTVVYLVVVGRHVLPT